MSSISKYVFIATVAASLLLTQACKDGSAPKQAAPEAAPEATKKADEAAKPAAAPVAAKATPAATAPAAAAPAADEPVNKARVTAAKKVVDQTADIMRAMVEELKAAGGDKAKMKTIQNTYKEKSMGIQKRGKELADKMNGAEKKLLQAHASEVLRPVIQEMFTLMNPHGGLRLPSGPRPPTAGAAGAAAAVPAPPVAPSTAGAVPAAPAKPDAPATK